MKEKQLGKVSRRVIASFISIPLLFNSLVPAYAMSWPVKQNNENEISEVYINPLYEDIVDEDDLKEFYRKGSVSTLALDDEEVPVFETMEEASAYLRDEMEARNETIEVKVLTDGYYNGMMKDLSDMALVHTGVPTEGDYIRWQFGGWKTQGSISDVNGKELVDVIYNVTYYTSAQQEKEVDQKVEEVLEELSPLMVNRPETVEAIYEYICDHVVYDHEHVNDSNYKLQFTAYGALINQTSVCQGYSVLLYRLLLEKGIDTRVITGTGNGNPHGWNIVQMGDLYYNADSTWDAGDTSKSWYLRSPEHFTGHSRDGDYTSAEFTGAYPMGSEDYKKAYSGVINWSADYQYADATFTVTGDPVSYTMPAVVTQEGSYQEPTCTEPGRQNASAEGQWKNGNGEVLASVHDKVDQTVPPMGHAYAEVEFEWNGIKEATATTRCVRCDHELTKTIQAVYDTSASIPATCEQEGVDVYCVDAEFIDDNGEVLIDESDTKSVPTPKITHSPSVNIQWDNETPTVEATCDVCHQILKTNQSVTELKNQAVAPTCLKEGEKVLRVRVDVLDEAGKVIKTVTDDHKVMVAKLSHEIDETSAVFEWNEYIPVSARAKCKVQGEWVDANEVSVEKDEKRSFAPTSATTGKNVWIATAIFKDGDKILASVTDEKEEILDVVTHEVTADWKWKEDGSAATVTVICKTHNRTFKDVEATVTKNEELSYAATCQRNGLNVFDARAEIIDESGDLIATVTDRKIVEIPALEHKYEATFEWAEDYQSAKATAECSVCKEVLGTVDAEIKLDEAKSVKPTGSAEGKNVYVATAVFKDEAGKIVATFTDEKIEVVAKNEVTPMYRLYNPNSGEHFYTANPSERQMLVDKGWTYEQIGWYAPATSNTPVYRMYNPNAGDHHYTASAGERDVLKSKGWTYEGIGWYSCDEQEVPLYRQYNPNAKAGAHNYTTNKAENDMLVTKGWQEEGIGWYGCKQ